MLEPTRSSPLADSSRSAFAAASPLPRSTSVKHLDCDTYTLMSAAGESSCIEVHHAFSGSVTASVPIFLSQTGICGGALESAAAVDRLAAAAAAEANINV